MEQVCVSFLLSNIPFISSSTLYQPDKKIMSHLTTTTLSTVTKQSANYSTINQPIRSVLFQAHRVAIISSHIYHTAPCLTTSHHVTSMTISTYPTNTFFTSPGLEAHFRARSVVDGRRRRAIRAPDECWRRRQWQWRIAADRGQSSCPASEVRRRAVASGND